MTAKRRQHNMNPYGNNFHRRSDDVTQGMVDVTKIAVTGAVTLGAINLMGGLLQK